MQEYRDSLPEESGKKVDIGKEYIVNIDVIGMDKPKLTRLAVNYTKYEIRIGSNGQKMKKPENQLSFQQEVKFILHVPGTLRKTLKVNPNKKSKAAICFLEDSSSEKIAELQEKYGDNVLYLNPKNKVMNQPSSWFNELTGKWLDKLYYDRIEGEKNFGFEFVEEQPKLTPYDKRYNDVVFESQQKDQILNLLNEKQYNDFIENSKRLNNNQKEAIAYRAISDRLFLHESVLNANVANVFRVTLVRMFGGGEVGVASLKDVASKVFEDYKSDESKRNDFLVNELTNELEPSKIQIV